MGRLKLRSRHRLLCGDSTNAEDVARLMAGAKADLCFTSPPYGQQRDYGVAKELVQDWDGLMRGVFANLPMSDAGQVLVNLGLIHRDGEWLPYWDGWIEWMREQGWRRFGWYVWDKMRVPPRANEGRLRTPYEWIFHFNRHGVPCREWVPCIHAGEDRGSTTQRGKNGKATRLSTPGKTKEGKTPPGLVSVFARSQKDGHPAPFPNELVEYFLKTWDGLVFEPFLGSGSTLIAAEQLDRRCFGMEIDPAYCDVIVKRWENLTGETAVLEA
jgi:DNA modification methylase